MCAEVGWMRFYNGRMAKFRLPDDEEAAFAADRALERKLADEDFDSYS